MKSDCGNHLQTIGISELYKQFGCFSVLAQSSRIVRLYLVGIILFIQINYQDAKATVVRASDFGWNVVDATRAFHNAVISDADTVIIDLQAGDWIVGPGYFKSLQNKTLIFESGVVLRAKKNAFPNSSDCMLKFSQARNIKIIGYGATIRMNKSEYSGMGGEWRHSISLLDCKNIEIYGFYLDESGGDGIYIRGDSQSGNILLKDLWCDHHYRQGISIISVKKLVVQNCWFTNTSGTLPECGLDLEPNNKTDILEDILFEKCRFTGNYGNGTVLALVNLDSTSNPIDIEFRDCYYSGNHHESNRYAGGDIRLGAAKTGAVNGEVTFNTCMVENSQWASVNVRKPANGYHATFNDCVFVNVSQDKSKKHNSPIWIEVTDYYNPCPRFGGVTFNNCLLSFDSKYPILGTFGNEPTSPGLGNVILNNLQVVHPTTNIGIDVTSGGGSPGPGCIFDYHKQKQLPLTSITLIAEGRLSECNGTNGLLRGTRVADTKQFPVGISYTTTGTAQQGTDFSRLNGFILFPAASVSQTDTIFVLKDELEEEIKSFTLTCNDTTLYTSVSLPQKISVSDCYVLYNELQEKYKFDIYPNPASEYIEIRLNQYSKGQIHIINSTGQVVLTKRISESRQRLPICELGHGIYIVAIEVEGSLFHRELIKL